MILDVFICLTSFTGNNTLFLDLTKWGGLPFNLIYSDWKENDIKKKLHLSYNVKKKVAIDLNNLCDVLQTQSTKVLNFEEKKSVFGRHP